MKKPNAAGCALQPTSIETAKIRIVIDIAFGDSVEPGLQEMDLPVLLDFPAPHLRAYARETVIAEKFQALVMLGRANSRMKDLYESWFYRATSNSRTANSHEPSPRLSLDGRLTFPQVLRMR
ncbi:nucleotidyl transferase AbiEii/AbiGii toxin family protein [Bradyrhizobium brasilense]|uniref:nucleotidyl transferase AbiEii/AbiGii toxin family protein n=1 Tax=Bradyrhizobium brasilense TaxID=1419277 RepID=UPI003221C1A1